ncbi:alpha-2-macroglobulin, partial [Parabacteroides sp. OttesenSCG-928-G06]|nr:alpha-2-macroglobulin [Parabacteroides sp. OttesenSCG-928-G06]
MKHLSISYLLLSAVIFGLFSCKQQRQPAEVIPSGDYLPYISAYTGGLISQKASITVQFTQPQDVVELSSELKENPFRFTPSLKGKSYWRDNKTLEFIPEEYALKPGQVYQASFSLGNYVKVPKELETFRFSFKVTEHSFSLETVDIDITPQHPEEASLRGVIRLSDVVDRKEVEKMFSVRTTDNQSLTLQLEPETASAQYTFRVPAIRRGEEDINLILTIDGKKAGMEKRVEEKILIPARNSFRFLTGRRIHEPEQGIQLSFSQPLSSNQDLTGLIDVSGLSSPVFQISDDKVNIFFEPSALSGDIVVAIDKGVKSFAGEKLQEAGNISFAVQNHKPQIELFNSGTILPDAHNLLIPFRAVSLRAVDIHVIRIYEDNVLMFMQNNNLSSSNELRRSGRLVHKQTLRLDTDPDQPLHAWGTYTVDLSQLIRQEPGAIYRVQFSMRKEYSTYLCGDEEETDGNTNGLTIPETEGLTDSDEAVWDQPNTYYDSFYNNMDWSRFDWDEIDNPCHESYYTYNSRGIATNLLATNLGVIVKQNRNNKMWITVTHILDTQAVNQADVTVYNFQLQPIGKGKTDANGFLELEPKGKPFIVVVTQGKQKTYLKLQEGEENSISRFDTGGKDIQKGLKGFVYGERGVWRPGDTLYITFMLEDREGRIPDSHPVSFEMYNPRGQFYNKQIATKGVNGFYTFQVATDANDPTGLWNGYVKVGGASFHKSFRIETVKPNRLKINLKLPGDYIDASKKEIPVGLHAEWLTGATAARLNAKVEMSLQKINSQFQGYDSYIFNDPATTFSSNKAEVFDGKLDEQGNKIFSLKLPESQQAPGMLRAALTTRVYEPGGDASIFTTTVPYSPFSSYVGINLNQPQSRYIETDKEHTFDVVTLNAEGKPVDRAGLEYRIYRISWSWWWENRNESFASYVNNTSITPEASGTISTVKGKASFTFRVDYPSWGRYLVYVKDKENGHATGGTVYIDWPDWRGRSDKTDPSGITMLSFTVDKESYRTGETVTVNIPAAAAGGRALVALENGSAVMQREWVQLSPDSDTRYQFKVTPEMAPNIYVHISLLQPHANKTNDLPIRMYGVVPVFITHQESILEPQIKMPDVLRPEKEFTLAVSEKNGKPMTYTLAIVDDGLLDLTNFKTPDPWSEFYAREALGIRTWDMFDQVIGAYTGSYSSLFSVGGDEMLKGQDSKANRFRPVVKFYGPFTLAKGKTDTHTITLPMYVGSVRTMVIAGQEGAYGNAEKTTPVRAPLMLLSTLPRVISIGEDILMPVNLFAMEKDVKQVTVTVETSDNLRLADGNKQTITFDEPGDKMVYFKLHAGNITQKETVRITASGNGHTTYETVEIDIRNPNPVITHYESKLLDGGQTADLTYKVSGNLSDSWVKLEVSRIPSVDISRRFDFLYNYEHFCTEQLTSRALPLLFIPQFKDVTTKEQEMITKNVEEAIRNLYGRQLPNGGFVYWPGNPEANEWISSYAGSFLVMAKEKGYDVSTYVLDKWKAYQKRAAQQWTPLSRDSQWHYWQSDLQQAYRLYTLALAGAPEQGAMNRMKEMENLSLQARWRLAAAYALGGKNTPANELVFNAKTTIEAYSSSNQVYGSYDRDEAM